MWHKQHGYNWESYSKIKKHTNYKIRTVILIQNKEHKDDVYRVTVSKQRIYTDGRDDFFNEVIITKKPFIRKKDAEDFVRSYMRKN